MQSTDYHIKEACSTIIKLASSCRLIIPVVLLMFYALQCVTAQTSAFKFKHLTVAEGLSQNTVSCILQDSRGFMWFGTWDGLNRYDGYTFTVFQNNPKDTSSIGGNRIAEMLEDKDGNLWIATSDGGISKYNRETGKFKQYRANPKQANSISSNNTTSISQDSKGIIWIGSNGGGLNRLDPSDDSFTYFRHDANDE